MEAQPPSLPEPYSLEEKRPGRCLAEPLREGARGRGPGGWTAALNLSATPPSPPGFLPSTGPLERKASGLRGQWFKIPVHEDHLEPRKCALGRGAYVGPGLATCLSQVRLSEAAGCLPAVCAVRESGCLGLGSVDLGVPRVNERVFTLGVFLVD